MRGESLVEHGEIRRDEVPRRQVAAQQLGKEQLGLLEGRLGEQVVEVIVRVRRGIGCGGHDLPEVEPVIEEGVDKPGRLRVRE